MGIEKIFGDLNAREVKKAEKIAYKVEALDEEMSKLTDDQLRGKTMEFKERLKNGETTDDILPEAFAVCREGAWRSLGMKHFHNQIVAGIIIHQGRIAELATGQGKTLVATLPAYLNALTGKGVHVVTVNDYLAKRDMEWMGKAYSFLGLRTGCVTNELPNQFRKIAYSCDITYGTNSEFGFDYLKDNMAIKMEDKVQRELNFAIVDEVDSILIDEARTPLIISGKGEESTDLYQKADKFVRRLAIDEDYTHKEKEKQVALTDEGVAKCEKFFGIDNFADPEHMEINHHVLKALQAHVTMQKERDYVIKDGEVVIVDDFTGRLMNGRRYSDGLHQAIEAKEGLEVRSENKTLATITLQNYFRMYQKLSGMTGTAKTEEAEFREIYNMDVVVVPPNQEIIRQDLDDIVFKTKQAKYKAIVEEVKKVNATGQPVLIGTISVDVSEELADIFDKNGIKNVKVLNAKKHDKEAAIVAQAGRYGAITIATNMAGRGTDILLGGNPEFEAKLHMEKEGYTADEIRYATSFIQLDNPDLNKARKHFHELLDKYKKAMAGDKEKVMKAGGLYIIGSERHESRRIDNQLRGRSGRQGDPGKSRFFLSLDDDLIRLFGGERMVSVVEKLGIPEDEAIESKIVTSSIESAQKKVEGIDFGVRKYVLQYDNVMNKQRSIIYEQRERVLSGENMRDYVLDMAKGIVEEEVESITLVTDDHLKWDFERLEERIKALVSNFELRKYTDEERGMLSPEILAEDIMEDLTALYEEKEAEVGEERMRNVERMVILRVVDNKWMDHIDDMDHLKQGIGLRSLGQQDPAAAYAHEGLTMFDEMIASIREMTVKMCFNITVVTHENPKDVTGIKKFENNGPQVPENYRRIKIQNFRGSTKRERLEREKAARKQQTVKNENKVGRNEPCPCGSGKKFKHCCGRG